MLWKETTIEAVRHLKLDPNQPPPSPEEKRIYEAAGDRTGAAIGPHADIRLRPKAWTPVQPFSEENRPNILMGLNAFVARDPFPEDTIPGQQPYVFRLMLRLTNLPGYPGRWGSTAKLFAPDDDAAKDQAAKLMAKMLSEFNESLAETAISHPKSAWKIELLRDDIEKLLEAFAVKEAAA